jgi:YVTN family beta-propeller protein
MKPNDRLHASRASARTAVVLVCVGLISVLGGAAVRFASTALCSFGHGACATAMADAADPTPAPIVSGSPAAMPSQSPAPQPSPAPPTAAPSPSATVSPTPHPLKRATLAPLRVTSPNTRMSLVKVITGNLDPKSVVASGTGLVVAQNMMYLHTINVYDATFHNVKIIQDSVDLAALGYPEYRGTYRGAPVEAAFSVDRKSVYVSNYSMYGASPFNREGHDDCGPGDGYPNSFVYRINLASLTIDQAIAVGAVPKYLAVTPDKKYLLVSNWCSYSLSVIALTGGKHGMQIKQIPLGPFPRGIAVNPTSTTAYVAVMGSTRIAVVDLRTFSVSWIPGVGQGPRHLVLSPDGRSLYATINGDGVVDKIDVASRTVVDRVVTGHAPRSMAIASDGGSLYVVNYESNTVSKLRASDMRVLQVVPTNEAPIGITYDPATHRVWVACYSGSIMVFNG